MEESTKMPDDPNQPDPQQQQQTGQTSGQTGATPDQLGDGGKAAIAAERKARRDAETAAAAFKAELDKLKQGQMSDLEKAQTAAAEATKDAETAKAEAMRWRIAAKHGISDEDAETFLTGTDEASLTKQAERLAALNTSQQQQQPPGRQPGPRPDLSQGGQQKPASSGDPKQDFVNLMGGLTGAAR